MEKWRGRRVVMLLLPPLEMKRMPTLPSLSVMVVVVVALMGQQMTPTDAFVPPDPHAYARLRDQLRVTTRNQHLLSPQQQGLGLIPFFPTPLRMLHPAAAGLHVGGILTRLHAHLLQQLRAGRVASSKIRLRQQQEQDDDDHQQGPSHNENSISSWDSSFLSDDGAGTAGRDDDDDDDELWMMMRNATDNGSSTESPPTDVVNDIPVTPCTAHLLAYVNGIQLLLSGVGDLTSTNDIWALEMLDATGKIPDGMLVGNLVSLGSFDECLAVRADITGDPLLIIGEGVSLDMLPVPRQFRGKYCKAQLDLKGMVESGTLPPFVSNAIGTDNVELLVAGGINPSMGICLPNTCTHQDLLDALDATAGGAGFQFVVQERDCAEDSATVFSAADYCIMALVAAVVMLMVAGTIVDVRLLATQAQLKKFDDHPQRLMDGEKSITSGFQLLKNDSAIQFLTSFSVYTNGKKILSTADHPDDIGCLHGLRFISMTWVILAHTYGFGGINPWVNLAQGLPAFLRQWEFTAVANASTSVDTFFLLSGLLVAYNVLKEVQRAKGRLRPDPVTWLGVLYVLRYVRLTPAFAAGIGLVATLVRRVGEGPLWGQLLENSDLCRHDWWKYLLYAHNYVRPDVYYDNQITCFPQAWYLACDMQLFLLAPLFILPMFYLGTTGRRRWAAYAWISLLTVISVVPGLVIMIRNSGYPPTLIPNNQQTAFFYDIYANTYVRAGPYLVGIALGYYIFMNKKQQNINDRSPSSTPASAAAPRLSRLVVALAWLAATGAALAVVYGLQAYEPYESDKPSHVENIFYSAFARMAWALAVAWLIFACHYGYGGPVNSLLKWNPFKPLGRLTYCSFLLSIYVQYVFQFSRKDVQYNDHPQMIYWFLGTLTLTTAGAFLFSLMFEMPFVGISKLLLSPARGSRTTKKPSSPAAAVTSPVESKNDGQVNPGFEAGPEGEKHVETTIIEVPKKAAVLSA